ncbi:hypothetical protein ACJMK2_028569 [Sinanodonta woodiana]|uniref:Uncharacterized protein n=1 Tax=Sinanodonta woodiana TaxID=1069815 RepID=A0ABD3X7J5_SINWO
MIPFTRTCFFLMIVAFGHGVYLNEDTNKEDHREETEDANLKGSTNDNICCIPDQWEGVIYFGYGDVFLDTSGEPNTFFTFVNGTINISYDKTNKKIYMRILGVQLTPLLPHPERVEMTYLFDYVHRIQYEFDDRKCDKSSLDADMAAQCVPVDILSESAGTLGASTIIYTYLYTKQSEVPYTVSASVIFDEIKTICTPIHVSFFNPSVESGSGILYGLDILDVTLGIKDPGIFYPAHVMQIVTTGT